MRAESEADIQATCIAWLEAWGTFALSAALADACEQSLLALAGGDS